LRGLPESRRPFTLTAATAASTAHHASRGSVGGDPLHLLAKERDAAEWDGGKRPEGKEGDAKKSRNGDARMERRRTSKTCVERRSGRREGGWGGRAAAAAGQAKCSVNIPNAHTKADVLLRPRLNGRCLSTCLGGLQARKSMSEHDRDVPVLPRHISEECSRDKSGLPYSGSLHLWQGGFRWTSGKFGLSARVWSAREKQKENEHACLARLQARPSACQTHPIPSCGRCSIAHPERAKESHWSDKPRGV